MPSIWQAVSYPKNGGISIKSLPTIIYSTLASVFFTASSAAYACPCNFSFANRIVYQTTELSCSAGAYTNPVVGHFAGIISREAKKSGQDEWEWEVSETVNPQGEYVCFVSHFKTGKNGGGREVRKDEQLVYWDTDKAAFNSCLDALDTMEGTARAGGATFAGASFDLGHVADSCNPVEFNGESFVPSADYLQ